MNDGSRNFSGLREEWSLLVHSIIDDSTVTEKIEKTNLQILSLDQIKIVKRELSDQRKTLNLKIEHIKGRIEHAVSVIENLELVGSDPDEIKSEIEDLNIEGEKISSEIAALDMKLNKIHQLKDKLILISESNP
jgi:hypothetical protein